MEKILKKYTTIPQHLYVERNADTQLRRIIEEMQRPGYVLVARQMGKTNLLFNAKRRLESENRLFVYVDLSNLFDDERNCYWNIIDNIIEPNIDLFTSIESDLYKIRDKKLPPHKEYSQSLRVILNQFKGDVVIILDEIDALKSVGYSDNIFAQIRSNYFSRTNFPEFERLTYVLSGVIEPTELIKDKNKSPFNIGDKIYLDDFTKEEHTEFIKKSKLKISNEISDEIFSWTNGNPRLTFDICSEIEEYLLQSQVVNDKVVQNLIKKKYLTNYDIAPIDHIRVLVKSNRQIRTAINNINRKETSKLNDEIKKKLYLYGIINSNFDEETFIKNKIIENSLSEDWIKSIDKLSENSFTYGLNLFENGEYKSTIETFLEFLSNSNPNKSEIEISQYYIGFSFYNLNEYRKAIEYFTLDFKEEPYRSNSKSLLGICKLGIGEIEEGISILEDLISNESNNFAYHNALLNLARNLSNKERAFELYQKLYDSTFKSNDIKEDELNELRTLALYYQAELYYQGNQRNEALERIKLALSFSNLSDSLYLLYFQLNLEENQNNSLKLDLVNRLVNNNLIFDTKGSHDLSFTELSLLQYLDLVFDSSELTLFNKLLDYSLDKIYKNTLNRFYLIYQASVISISKKNEILNYLLASEESIKEDLIIDIYRDYTFNYSDNKTKYLLYFNKYLKIFKRVQNVIIKDIYLFTLAIRLYSDLNKIPEAFQLCEIIDERLKGINDEEIKFESVVIYYWYSLLFFSVKNKEEATFFADKALQLISDSKKKRTSVLDEEGLKYLSQHLKQIKTSIILSKPITSLKKYGRNDIIKVKYKDERISEGKYKKFEADILANRCTII